MTLPSWYIWTVTLAVLLVGMLGIALLCLLASAAILDRIMRLVQLHDCFIDFMVGWVRQRHERLEAARDKRPL